MRERKIARVAVGGQDLSEHRRRALSAKRHQFPRGRVVTVARLPNGQITVLPVRCGFCTKQLRPLRPFGFRPAGSA